MIPKRLNLYASALALAWCLLRPSTLLFADEPEDLTPQVELNKDGGPKRIRFGAHGDWLKPVELTSTGGARVFIADPMGKGKEPSDSIDVLTYGRYTATLFTFYRSPGDCQRDLPANQCEKQLWRAEQINVKPLKSTVNMHPEPLVAEASRDQDESYAPISSLDSLHVAALARLTPIAVATFPIAGQVAPPLLCDGKGEIQEIKGPVQPPVVIRRVDPEYTKAARRHKYKSQVILHMILDTEGRPNCIRVVRQAKYGLEQAAIDAVNQWRFQPSTLEGKPVPVELQIAVNFRIF